jgi:hypothetical protein
MMCEGSITSILPTETISHFGEDRGPQIYAYLFSSFGASAIFGSVIVRYLQYIIGFTGMLYICLSFTVLSGCLTFFYKSNTKFNYHKAYRKQLGT